MVAGIFLAGHFSLTTDTFFADGELVAGSDCLVIDG